MADAARRGFLKTLLASPLLSLGDAARGEGMGMLAPTPGEVAGPFYPIYPPPDQDFDLTRVHGQNGTARGRIILIEGRVLDTRGRPVADVSVEIWQANAAGRYHHPHDTNRAPLDPDFQGWAIVLTGSEGRFRFKTVMPGAYPAGRDWRRPPHIHYRLSKSGYRELITQMYFPGQPLNDQDLLLQQKSPEERQRMIASQASTDPESYAYQIVLTEVAAGNSAESRDSE